MKNITVFLIVSACILGACNHRSAEELQAGSAILLSDSASQASCVSLAEDNNSMPVISWAEVNKVNDQKTVFMAFFDKNNQRFSLPVKILVEQNTNFHEEGMPELAIKDDGTIFAIYETSAPTVSNKFAGFVHYIFSRDKGRTWSQPACVHANAAPGTSHSFAAITRLGNGEIGACWLDESLNEKSGGRPVMFARTGPGNKFENQVIVDSVACQCCRIAVNSNAGGKITVAFRDIISDSIRDMSVSSSDDMGKTFSRAVSFSKDRWVVNGCPHNGPSVANDSNMTYAAWFTGGQQRGVYYCEMNDRKEMLSKQLVSEKGRFIQLCMMPDGSRMLAYNENVQEPGNVYSKIVVNKISKGQLYTTDITIGKSMASYPVIRPFGADKIIVAWSDNNKIYFNVVDVKGINRAVQPSAGTTLTAMQHDFSHVKCSNSKDLVCGMPLSLAPGDTALFKGRIYGFCSDICKNEFLKKPGSFAVK